MPRELEGSIVASISGEKGRTTHVKDDGCVRPRQICKDVQRNSKLASSNCFSRIMTSRTQPNRP